MPLSFSTTGSVVTIKDIKGKDETRRFLESLGFVVGGNVSVVSEIDGNLIGSWSDGRRGGTLPRRRALFWEKGEVLL